MTAYVARRLVHMIPVLLLISIFIFFLVRLVPGDPASSILGDKASDETVAALRDRLHLDDPIIVQYGVFLRDALTGDLGTSIRRGEPVVDVLLVRVPVTLFLAFYAAFLAVVIAVPLATLAALKHGRWQDTAVRAFAMISLAMPAYWVGMMLLQVFAVKYDIFPVAGYGDGFIEHLQSLFLPALALALSISSVLIRSLRNSLLDTLTADYVRTARAKGLGGRQVFVGHALRTSALSAITILGVNLAYLVGGAAVVETIFAIPGLGQLVVKAIFDRDYPLIQGATLFFGIMVLMINLATDICYALLDPRVTYS